MLKRIFRHSGFKYFVGLVYAILFFIGYIKILNVRYGYASFEIQDGRLGNTDFILYTFFVSLFPLLFYRGVRQISSFISIFIYFVLYISIVITFFFVMDQSVSHIMRLQFLFMIGMSILFLADRFSLKAKLVFPYHVNLMGVVLILTWISSLYIAYVFRNTLNFASYDDVYLQRSATEGIGTDAFTGYLGTWLANVMIPICATYGLFAKKKWYFIAAVFGALICYMSKADKSIFLFPVFILGLFYFLRNSNLKNSFSSIGIGLSSIMAFTLIVPTNIFFIAIFWMRTLGTGGILTNFYDKFFIDHPLTYYSHVRIINAITGNYPYGDLAVGQVVGKEYWSDDMNANANFWAIDGIASIGELGILLASFLLFCIFILFNRVCKGYNKLFIICILIPYITILLNQSLFSSLVTGGGFWILIILSFKSTINNPYINENFNNNRS